ncbi:pilus assembly protein PilC [Comamonas piscis]|uniref:Pilus assembly protein PilC n=1 Tax=Comamonas piscis TaxID=1562974 RepID=A0A7G5EFL6_9BURK|nr:PilC/PilY family type IV pilus protein [Comamonas piscis]QMV72791.1 pilus assembly protein PilC [Comamonas piscis]WSO35568.1 PilC/PilY family type IV pilus protein [Comamonas piscis]
MVSRHHPPTAGQMALACIALLPAAAWPLELATEPTGGARTVVTPNVIVSVDDSAAMQRRMGSTEPGLARITAPDGDGSWDARAQRMAVLRHTLKAVLGDGQQLPDGAIRLAWQAMWNHGAAPGGGQGGMVQGQRRRPGASTVNSPRLASNGMQALQGRHRQQFLAFADSLSTGHSSDLHHLFDQADAYLRRPLSPQGPWSSQPGAATAASSSYLGCRRNYHIVLAGSRWDGPATGGAQDDHTRGKTLPDGQVYGGGSAAQRAATALYSDTVSSTLADWAFRSWADPLQRAGLIGSLAPEADYRHAPPRERFADGLGQSAVLERYWNPRYNPASWPHLQTYTVGIGRDASTWPGAAQILAPTQQLPFGYDGSFAALAKGDAVWPDMQAQGEGVRALDLWHAAINGRGRFYAATDASDVAAALRSILADIQAQHAGGTLGAAKASTGAASASQAIAQDALLFTASYDPGRAWSGAIQAQAMGSDGRLQPAPGWGGQTTADKLDAIAWQQRLVLSWGDAQQRGVPFRWAADESYLSAAHKQALQGHTDGDQGKVGAAQRLDYLRGERRHEAQHGGSLRNRQSRQGDIVHSQIWYLGKPSARYSDAGYIDFVLRHQNRLPMLYVGGNAGMLHGFSALTGEEKIAYVPRGVIPSLRALTSTAYDAQHRYFVDGSPLAGDANLGSASNPHWRSLLAGTLGAGGKGYFVLDVTEPETMFAEAQAAELVLMDRSWHAQESAPRCDAESGLAQQACVRLADAFADIGHITASPARDDIDPQRSTQIAQLNNGRWALVLGNGYNSANGRPVLLIQYLDGAQELLRLVANGASAAQDNGLSAARLVDINGDGRPDVVYAGDNQGNLWKFLISADNDQAWGVAQWGALAATTSNHATAGVPLYQARGGQRSNPAQRSQPQPISTAPLVRSNDRLRSLQQAGAQRQVPVGGLMVAFGTGRNITRQDPQDDRVQSLYAVLDNSRYKRVGERGERVEVCASAADAECQSALGSDADLPTPVAQSQLLQRRVNPQALPARSSDSRRFWTMDESEGADALDWNQHRGWYLDLPEAGERLLQPLGFYSGSNLLAVISEVPVHARDGVPGQERCEPVEGAAARQYFSLLNIIDGLRPRLQLLDADGDALYDGQSDGQASRMSLGAGPHAMLRVRDDEGQQRIRIDGEALRDLPEVPIRPSWRHAR